MNKKDLRIGNLLYSETSNCLFDKGIVEVDFNTFEKIHLHDCLKFLKPITLNAEWLEKFGFKKNNMYWIDDTNIGFTFHKNGDIEWNQPKNIKYVHELQNLYFALTGKELAKV